MLSDLAYVVLCVVLCRVAWYSDESCGRAITCRHQASAVDFPQESTEASALEYLREKYGSVDFYGRHDFYLKKAAQIREVKRTEQQKRLETLNNSDGDADAEDVDVKLDGASGFDGPWRRGKRQAQPKRKCVPLKDGRAQGQHLRRGGCHKG